MARTATFALRLAAGEDVVFERLRLFPEIVVGSRHMVEAHRDEFLPHLVGVGLADDEIAADVEDDPLQSAFGAALAEPLTVDLAVTVERRDEYRLGAGFDRGVDVLVLTDHHAEVDHLEAAVPEKAFEYLVADGVAVRADDAHHDHHLFVHDQKAPPHGFTAARRRPTGAPSARICSFLCRRAPRARSDIRRE